MSWGRRNGGPGLAEGEAKSFLIFFEDTPWILFLLSVAYYFFLSFMHVFGIGAIFDDGELFLFFLLDPAV